MSARELVRRWFGSGRDGPPSVAARDRVSGPATVPQSRRRARAAGDRAALWTEEPETCERCGRRLLTGELPALFQVGDEVVLVCPVCAMDMATAGFRSPDPSSPVQHQPETVRREAA